MDGWNPDGGGDLSPDVEDEHLDERLAAYAAGDLDPDGRAEVEADLGRDPTLRDRLAAIQRVDRALASLPPVTPPEGFRARLERTVGEVDELAERRERRRRAPLRALAAAGVAAAAVAVLGVGAGLLLGGRDEPQAASQLDAAADDAAGPQVAFAETDNDYDDVELQRLAVNLDTQFTVPPNLAGEQAAAYAAQLQAQVTDEDIVVDDAAGATGAGASGEGDAAAEPAPEAAQPEEGDDPALETLSRAAADDGQPARLYEELGDAAADVERCLPQLLQSTSQPLVPVYVELARYGGEPVIVYAFAAEDPDRGTYARVEVWAVARSDCQVLSLAQYDRP